MSVHAGPDQAIWGSCGNIAYRVYHEFNPAYSLMPLKSKMVPHLSLANSKHMANTSLIKCGKIKTVVDSFACESIRTRLPLNLLIKLRIDKGITTPISI